ncbi:hypothetical protein FG379_000958 [Cryptosporidium bovis]|uniref:uncharacterized protein n=1 Tax=Cryptosporidium bovis TaxID=310047 RepID=UPI00351A5587|nr:hypothetical protein FG379_000958 [Cryptosporidium bovis]
MSENHAFKANNSIFNVATGNESGHCLECGGLHNYNINNSYISNDIKYMIYCHKKSDIEIKSKRGRVISLNFIINKKIVNSKTLDEMLQIITDHIESFNEVNMVTMIHRIAVKCSNWKQRSIILKDRRFIRLFEGILYISSYSHRYSPLELANLSWSLVKLGINDHVFFDYICNESILLLEQFVPISLSILLCSFAKLVKFYKNLYMCSIPKILLELDNMEPQQISNIAWSYSKVGLISPHLFEKLKNRSIEIVDRFFPIHISMLCHAFALTDIVPKNFLELVSKFDIQSFTPKSAVHLLWSFSITRFKIPSEWILWICDNKVITTLSITELILLATSLSMCFVDGFVQIKLNNIIDYNQIISNINIKMNIFKAIARRNRDPNDTFIEWNSSLDTIEITKDKSNGIVDPLNNNLIWNTIDVLANLISRKFKSKNDIIDIVWILCIIGKNLSPEFCQIIEPHCVNKVQKYDDNYRVNRLTSPLINQYSIENTPNTNPTSTSASNNSYQNEFSYGRVNDETDKHKNIERDFRNNDINSLEISNHYNKSLVDNNSNYTPRFYTPIFLLYSIILMYFTLYK